jgi:type I restriction enzyme S subunit
MSQAINQVIPEGYKLTDAGVIPSDWDVKQVKDVCGFIVPGRNKPRSFSGNIPWVTTSDIDHLNRIETSKIFLHVSREEATFIGSKVVPKNAVIMSCVGELGVVALVHEEIVINQQLHAFIPTKTIDGRYLSYVLASLKEYFYSKATKTTLPYLNKDNCNSTLISMPILKEQTAIANALSDVDALLSELENLITKKQAIKTATIQQLLTGKTRLPQFAFYSDINSTEGAVEGKRSNASATNVNVGACDDGSLASQESGGMDSRRKGTKPSELGEIPEDWEVYALSSLLNESPKYGINAAAVPLVGSLPVYIRITDISEGGYFRPKEKVGVDSSLSYLYKLNKGDLVLARTGASVGKSYLYRDIDGELVYAGFLIKISPNTKKLSSEYLSHYLKTDQYWSWITVNSMRSGQPGVNGNEFGSLQLPVPDIKEQTAIATILSDMDNEIQTLEQRLSKTRQIKQGMMQELLTGKTRLPFARLVGESDAD